MEYNQPIIEENHRMRGALGALGGALTGGLIWMLIGCLGYMSGWIAVLGFMLANGGYTLFNKKKSDIFGVVISFIFGLAVIAPATYGSFAFQVLQALKEGLSGRFSYGEVLVDLPLYMSRYDWWGDFWMSMLKGYIFTIIVGIGFLADGISKQKKQETN